MTNENYRVKALLLAAGMGTRLQPLTNYVPKCLVPIGGRPLLDFWLELLREAGIQVALINTHHLRSQVTLYIDQKNGEGDFQIAETFEERLLGSAGTITANGGWMDDADDCLVIYTDNLSTVNLNELIDFHRSHSDPITMLLFRAPRPQECGIAKLDNQGRIVEFVEKPQNPSSNLANAGVYVIRGSAFREIAGMQAFDLGHEVLPKFEGRMRGWVCDGYHRDIGSLDALESARREAPFHRFHEPRQPARKAVFIDRDGTIIEHVHHLTDPDKVRLLPGVPQAIHKLKTNGYACVVVTNQSVVGRGLLSEAGLQNVHERMIDQLGEHDLELDGLYVCTLPPLQPDQTVVENIDRKPGPGMLLRSAREMSLAIDRSWMVGDSISDVLAGQNAGCRGTVLLSHDAEREGNGKQLQLVAPDFPAAVEHILHEDAARTLIQRNLKVNQ